MNAPTTANRLVYLKLTYPYTVHDSTAQRSTKCLRSETVSTRTTTRRFN